MIRRGSGRVGRPGLLRTMGRTGATATEAEASDQERAGRLHELADLKERGLLTDTEFAAQKERLLAG